MPETTTTTLADHAILFRQAGDGFYLTDRGAVILMIFFFVLAVIAVSSLAAARR